MTSPESNVLHFKSAWVESESGVSEWRDHVAITVQGDQIIGLDFDKTMGGDIPVRGVAIPGMVNVHSHAFQRGFSGLTEFRSASQDSFWTWRNLMYSFVGRLTPDDVFVIARQLYLEMIVAGYSWVGEFHYLHNNADGTRYSNDAEMLDAVLQAAQETGIGICLLPVLYQRSGFDSDCVQAGQKRFALSNDQFFQLLTLTESRVACVDNAAFGLALHSIRAVDAGAIRSVLDFRNGIRGDIPVHIHIAEQIQEVEDCIRATGRRSVEFLLSEFEIDKHWCLIHATHMTPSEILAVARSGAIVGLCPTTEANLGDGVFPAEAYFEHSGAIAIGSDSHCSVDVREELRLLEYGQRLQDRRRAILGTETESVGRRLYRAAAIGGAAAIGVPTGRIRVGGRADLVVVDDGHASIAGASGDRLLDRFVFSNSGNPISERMIGGKWIDENRLNRQLRQSAVEFAALNRRLFD